MMTYLQIITIGNHDLFSRYSLVFDTLLSNSNLSLFFDGQQIIKIRQVDQLSLTGIGVKLAYALVLDVLVFSCSRREEVFSKKERERKSSDQAEKTE